MLTTIDQFAGKDIWVYAELEYEDAYIRVEKVFDNGTVWYNAWLPSDSYSKYDIDEILYGELTGDVNSIEIHPLDTLTTEELIAKIKADGKISGCSKVTSSRKFTKYPQGYVKAWQEPHYRGGYTRQNVQDMQKVNTGGGCYSVVAYIDAKRDAVVSDLTDAFTVSIVRSSLDSLSDCIDAFFTDRGQVIVNAPNFDSVPDEYKDLYLKMTNLLNS